MWPVTSGPEKSEGKREAGTGNCQAAEQPRKGGTGTKAFGISKVKAANKFFDDFFENMEFPCGAEG